MCLHSLVVAEILYYTLVLADSSLLAIKARGAKWAYTPVLADSSILAVNAPAAKCAYTLVLADSSVLAIKATAAKCAYTFVVADSFILAIKAPAAKCAYTLVVAEIVAKCTDTPVAACTSCALVIRRSRTHISVLLRALVKKLYGNAQVFKPQSTIRPQNPQRLLLQLIRCSTSIQHAVSFTRTLTLSHV